MFGKNPKRKPEQGSGETLDIQEIFPTIQGEGPNSGQPAVFIRLGGCNLACSFCDTEFENFVPKNIDAIISEVLNLSLNQNSKRTKNLVVITGGEPMRQPIELLCSELIKENFKVQIETNGTIFRNLDDEVEIICSPKNNGNGYAKIRDDLLQKITAFKFIISDSNEDYNKVPEVGQTAYNIPVYIQPMDEYKEQKNKANTELTSSISLESGYLFSMQIHKIIGIS